jgi:CheY-like chemotaxis protein
LEKKKPTEASKSADARLLELWKKEGLALVADDEESVRLFAREILRRHGLDVITAHDGREAIDLFEIHKDRLSIALIDLMMPHINGQEVLAHIRKNRSDLPVVLSSGFTETEIKERFTKEPPSSFIQKPYRSLDLVRIIKTLLDNESPIRS